jgi:hypothetical protein
VYLDYALLGVLSTAMLVYAYLRRPDPPSDDDDGGGTPVEDGGDSSPTGTPPSVHVPDPDKERETVPV